MGATGALKFGLTENLRGVIAIAPHIDLDISAEMQRRMRHVQAIVEDGDALSEKNFPITRQIRQLVLNRSPELALPRLYMQSCKDDIGVFQEQLLPLAKMWIARGGVCELDIRAAGGHTSDFATRNMLLDLFDRMDKGERAPVEHYQSDPSLRGEIIAPSFGLKLKRLAARTRNRVLRRHKA